MLLFHGRNRAFYLVDLKSFHSTFVNDIKITPWVPCEVDYKSEIKIGGSSRIYIVKEGDLGLAREELTIEDIVEQQQQQLPSHTEKKVKTDHKPEEFMFHVSHLLVKHKGSRNPTSWRQQGTITRTEDLAVQIITHYKQQIDRGDYTFAELAKRYSDCNSAGKGGELAPFREGTMQPAFEKAVKLLRPGEISNTPVFSDSGVHIIFRHK